MRRLLLCGCCCGCSSVDVGLSPAEGGSSGIAETTALSTSTSSGGPERVDTSSGAVSTTSTSDGSDSASSSSSTSGGDTEGLEESPCQAEQKVCAEVELDGAPVGFCGQTLTLLGNTSALGPGRWSIVDCDACEPCAGTSYDVQIIAPMGWVPLELPDCARIAIDFAPLDDSPFACAFTGVAIWDELGGSAEDPAPVYVAASIVTDPPAAVAGLEVAKTNIEPKACVEPGCCWMDPGKYSLTFSGAALAAPIELIEHEMAMAITAFSQPYDLRDERSHAHEQCDKIPHFDWILRR
jgi:hypothetical protein